MTKYMITKITRGSHNMTTSVELEWKAAVGLGSGGVVMNRTSNASVAGRWRQGNRRCACGMKR